MPFAQHIRMSALGRLGTSGERFSWSLNFAPFDPLGALGINFAPNAAAFTDMANDVRNYFIDAGLNISSQAVLEEVKFANIGPLGKYTSDPFIVDVADAPGQNAGFVQLAQIAVAVSLTTDRRGPSGKGRYYLPMPCYPVVSGDLRYSDVNRDLIATASQTFLNNINNAVGLDVGDIRVVVASTKGFNTAVTGVRVGRVPDTIRSRRRGLPEAYDAPLAVS